MPSIRRVNNFGDKLGPLIVHRILQRSGLPSGRRGRGGRLLTVGSILHFARDGDTIWGSGINGKIPDSLHDFTSLDVRAVRGPITATFLRSRGIEVPEVYGDPALLLPDLYPDLVRYQVDPVQEVLVVPNLNEKLGSVPDHVAVLDPREPIWRCLVTIAQSKLVVASSLHALIVAEAFGIPARSLRVSIEHPTKYLDYYQGTGRSGFSPAESIRAAIALGGEEPPVLRRQILLDSFPFDLWRGSP